MVKIERASITDVTTEYQIKKVQNITGVLGRLSSLIIHVMVTGWTNLD